jgi:pyocin large subunit-like protein
MAIKQFVKHVESLQEHQVRAQHLRFDQHFNQQVKSRHQCVKTTQNMGDDLIILKNLLKKVLARHQDQLP